ncbi:MAG: branched-chain amino acid ABC transporter permease [Candidatus Bathyarchaeia archaeon]
MAWSFKSLEKHRLRRNLLITLVGIIVLSILPLFLDAERSYFIFFLYNIFLYVTMSTSWNIVSGYSGQFSLGHGAFFGLGAYVAAISWREGLTGYFDIRAFLLSAAISALMAAAIGYPLLAKLKGFYFALGTLALNEIFRLLAVNGGAFTGGAVGIQLPSRYYAGFATYYYAALLIMVISSLIVALLLKLKTGLNFIAVRDDEVAAESIGIHALHHKVLAFSLSAIPPALCGTVFAYYIFHIQPSSVFSASWGLYPPLMSILGGIGTIIGPIIGSVVIGSMVQLIEMFVGPIHPLVSGALLIILIVVLPKGILGKIREKKKIKPFS